MTISDRRTIIDEFENILGVPFDPQWTKSISIDVPTARRLAHAVQSFYAGFRFPEKDPGELRPYLFHSYAIGEKPWHNFVRFEGDKYSFAPSRNTDLFGFLKPFLLYSHGICFLDPLPGLLDYFRPSPEESDYEKARLPGVEHLLFEYVKIADLIRHRIVVPISYEAFGDHSRNNFLVSDKEEREITQFLAGIPRYHKEASDVDVNRHVAALIKEQLWLNQRAENRIDLYFPHDSYVPILQGLLRAASQRYNSKQIYEPFAVSVLADLTKLDTSQISTMDIISIRSEQAFDEYRRVLQRILRRLQDEEGRFSDLESEFAVAAREEMAECDARIKQLTKNSNVLKDTLRKLDRILIGGAAGFISGVLDGSLEVAAFSAATGAFCPLYDIVRGAWTASASSALRVSLRHHFLVLDPKVNSPRRSPGLVLRM